MRVTLLYNKLRTFYQQNIMSIELRRLSKYGKILAIEIEFIKPHSPSNVIGTVELAECGSSLILRYEDKSIGIQIEGQNIDRSIEMLLEAKNRQRDRDVVEAQELGKSHTELEDLLSTSEHYLVDRKYD
jgi:uncharacterized OB-fold protein